MTFPALGRFSLGRHGTLPGLPLSLGVAASYLGLVVLLPLAGLAWKALGLSAEDFWAAISGPRALASYRVTLVSALQAVTVNGILGLLFAWVLARYDFPGRRLLDGLMDLPFALPTAVAGVALSALLGKGGPLWPFLDWAGVQIAFAQPGIVVAMIFTSLPFVVRTVQPVIEDLDPEQEEAAHCLGASDPQIMTRITLPVILPALITGCTLALARCLGEFGAIIFIAGNRPFETEITALLIFIRLEEYSYGQATAIAVTILAASFAVMLAANLLQAWQQRYLDRN